MSATPNKQEVSKALGLKVKKVTAVVNGVYRLELSNGKAYALKPLPFKLAKVKWIDNTLLKVRKQGFTRIAWRDAGEEAGKKLVYQLRGKQYILSPWIDGRWPSPKSLSDMKQCGETLAQLHRASRGISISSKHAVNKLYSWPKELKSKQRSIEQKIKKASKNGFGTPLDAFLQKNGATLIGYCRDAKRLLKGDYKVACRQARSRKVICHGDGGPTNFIMNKDGTHLIDFETLRIDLVAYDLYRVIYNSCKDHNWDFKIAKAILDGYQGVSRLSKRDIALTKVWLRFPRTTDLLLRQYARANSKRAKLNIAKQMDGALADERKMTSFLKQLDEYAKNRK